MKVAKSHKAIRNRSLRIHKKNDDNNCFSVECIRFSKKKKKEKNKIVRMNFVLNISRDKGHYDHQLMLVFLFPLDWNILLESWRLRMLVIIIIRTVKQIELIIIIRCINCILLIINVSNSRTNLDQKRATIICSVAFVELLYKIFL